MAVCSIASPRGCRKRIPGQGQRVCANKNGVESLAREDPPEVGEVASCWRARAPELAEWAWLYLVVRTDVWGAYGAPGAKLKTYTAPGVKWRGEKNRLTMNRLVRHFQAT